MDNKRRFVSTTDEEIEQKRLKMNAQKTIKQNIAAAILLREYLKENVNFFLFDCVSRRDFLLCYSKSKYTHIYIAVFRDHCV